MTGEIDPVSHKLGQLDGTVTTLVAQNSALFREVKASNVKIDRLVTSFAEHTAEQREAILGMISKHNVLLEHVDIDVDPHIDSFKTFAAKAEEETRLRTRQRNILLAAVPAIGVAINQLIEFFKNTGHP